jgi:uncharacterized membrane protein/predicted DsbA family dithiol-disulfide isomerase
MNDPPRPERTTGTATLAASLLPVLAGLVASAILMFDYLRPVPLFCAEGGGCDAVRRTAIAGALGIPLPVVGVAGFLAIGVASLLTGQRARLAQVTLASFAGVTGVLLLAAQAMVGHFCVYCSLADASAIAVAVASWWRFARSATVAPRRGLAYAGAGLLALAILVPLGLGALLAARPPPTPAVILAEIARTPAGKVTVVDFVDFECPFCRMTNDAFEPLLAAHQDRVRCVRRQVPLTAHPHALDAARAAHCGDVLGKGDALAKALFAAPVDQLTPEGCEKVAHSVGVALVPYRACVADPKTDASIEADRAVFKAAGGYALPTIWIDRLQLVGAQPPEALAAALDGALARAPMSGP